MEFGQYWHLRLQREFTSASTNWNHLIAGAPPLSPNPPGPAAPDPGSPGRSGPWPPAGPAGHDEAASDIPAWLVRPRAAGTRPDRARAGPGERLGLVEHVGGEGLVDRLHGTAEVAGQRLGQLVDGPGAESFQVEAHAVLVCRSADPFRGARERRDAGDLSQQTVQDPGVLLAGRVPRIQVAEPIQQDGGVELAHVVVAPHHFAMLNSPMRPRVPTLRRFQTAPCMWEQSSTRGSPVSLESARKPAMSASAQKAWTMTMAEVRGPTALTFLPARCRACPRRPGANAASGCAQRSRSYLSALRASRACAHSAPRASIPFTHWAWARMGRRTAMMRTPGGVVTLVRGMVCRGFGRPSPPALGRG